MSKYTKYKLYQKYETRGSQEAIPVYPNTFSIDGDGTMPVVIVEENSRDCGYTGDTQPIYRWYNMPIDKYYVCDACQDYENHYLTLVARGSGAFKKVNHSETFQYSRDNGSTWTDATSATSISVNSGDRVMFKGTLTPSEGVPYGVGTFSASTQFEAEGNVMSLLYGDNFIGQISLQGKNKAFYDLFINNPIISIDNLVLPATTLSELCYGGMFYLCTSLTSIPSGFLPATTLADECYHQMFQECTSLTTLPSDLLPATTLEYMCYDGMFNLCSGLTSIPSGFLPATTLANSCYSNMFQGCTSLTTVPSNLLPVTTLENWCYYWMFGNCTSLTTAPNLPAATLAEHCYEGMYNGCTNLSYVKCLATNISANDCTYNWLNNVSSNGTFVKNSSMSGWTRGTSGIPTNWTVQNA